MLYRVTVSTAMLAVILAMLTIIAGCANQQKDDLDTEEVSLNVTGMV